MSVNACAFSAHRASAMGTEQQWWRQEKGQEEGQEGGRKLGERSGVRGQATRVTREGIDSRDII